MSKLVFKYPKPREGVCTIYTASCQETNAIMYIGQTGMRLHDRAMLHLHSGKGLTEFSKWVQATRAKGLKPVFHAIDTVPANEALYWEQFYISLFTQWGYNLLNIKKDKIKFGI